MIRHTRIATDLGPLTLVAAALDEAPALTAVYFDNHAHLPENPDFGPAVEAADEPVLALAAAELAEFLAGERTEFTVPLAPAGDEFSRRLWARLQEIPYGATTTYGELAAEFGNVHLAQRVGQVLGHNPISILIPCHRVLGANGDLVGYAGGLVRKRHLLDLETPGHGDRLF